jgi:hypothetical protein
MEPSERRRNQTSYLQTLSPSDAARCYDLQAAGEPAYADSPSRAHA